MLIKALMLYNVKRIPSSRDDKPAVHRSIKYRNILTLKNGHDDQNIRINKNQINKPTNISIMNLRLVWIITT